MIVAPRMKGDSDWHSVAYRAAVNTGYVGLIVCNVASCQVAPTDTSAHNWVTQRDPSYAGRVSDEESKPMVHRTVVVQRTLPKEARKSISRRSVTKVHLPNTTGASGVPPPRASNEESKEVPAAEAEKKQLFEEFQEWLKQRPRDMP
jgi:hypothetical protein